MEKLIALTAVLLVAVALSACSPVLPPIVDKANVDEATYTADLEGCYRSAPAVTLGNPITKCMEAKGYRIIKGF